MNWMPEAIRDGIIVVLVISGPLVLAAAFIGLVVGVLQAATQVQEQTIGSALKIIGVFGLIIVVGFWMYQYLNNYTSRTIAAAFTFVPRQTQKAVPSDAFKDERFQERFIGVIESKIPDIGVPAGVPYLGAQEIPKAPAVGKFIPPKIQEPKIPLLKPEIPLGEYQEPKPFDQEDPLLNLVPGESGQKESPKDESEIGWLE